MINLVAVMNSLTFYCMYIVSFKEQHSWISTALPRNTVAHFVCFAHCWCWLIIAVVVIYTVCVLGRENRPFFTSCWLACNQLSWNALLFSCNLIGKLCLRGPGYSSRIVSGLNLEKIEELFLFSRNEASCP